MFNSWIFKIRARSGFAIGLANAKQVGDAKIFGGTEHIFSVINKKSAFRVEVNLFAEILWVRCNRGMKLGCRAGRRYR